VLSILFKQSLDIKKGGKMRIYSYNKKN
jgi:hypothetical protein